METEPGNHPIDPGRLSAASSAADESLEKAIERYGSMAVAFSGGVDSGLLAYASCRILGAERMLCVIGVSPSFPKREEDAAVAFLDAHGIPFERIVTNEIENERYRENNPDRCYHCKSELFGKIRDIAVDRGFPVVAFLPSGEVICWKL